LWLRAAWRRASERATPVESRPIEAGQAPTTNAPAADDEPTLPVLYEKGHPKSRPALARAPDPDRKGRQSREPPPGWGDDGDIARMRF
jgi:hypothetical protein